MMNKLKDDLNKKDTELNAMLHTNGSCQAQSMSDEEKKRK